jgi:hypothetical protein
MEICMKLKLPVLLHTFVVISKLLVIVTGISDYSWGLDWWIDLLTSYTIRSYLQAIWHYHWFKQLVKRRAMIWTMGLCSSPGRVKNFFFPTSRLALGPPSLQSNGYQGSFPGGKAAAAWSLPLASKIKIKKIWVYTSNFHIRLHGAVLN